MGFKTVYQVLMDVFPQVDVRMLKAVALEHSKDADAAVEAVLNEVLPVLENQSFASKPTHQPPEEESENEYQTDLLRRRPDGSRKNVIASPSKLSSASWVDDLKNDLLGFDSQFGSSSSQPWMNMEPVLSLNVQEEVSQLRKAVDNEELILLQKSPNRGENPHFGLGHIPPVVSNDLVSEGAKCNGGEIFFDTENEIPSQEILQQSESEFVSEQITYVMSPTVVEGEVCSSGGSVVQNTEEIVSHASMEYVNLVVGEKESEVDTRVNAASESELVPEQIAQVLSAAAVGDTCSIGGSTAGQNAAEEVSHAFVEPVDVIIGEEIPEVNTQAATATEVGITEAEQGTATGLIDLGIPSSPSSVHENVIAQQDLNIEVLDEFIEAGKNNKKTLFSAVESVMNKMREVELKEKEAEEAELEAATAGLDIQVQAEELKKMLSHAKEANDMHAGEVYGEKAILATEVKELQSRVLNLSEERDTAITIIDEMHCALEDRLAAAEELLAGAEKQKEEKEESARKALSEEQSVMEKLVQESKMLQEAAEENSKLREFLMDRGHVVDMLQGEISVLCQDVRLLKEKIDNRVPLSQSISSSQTSCILASSGSFSTGAAVAVDVFPKMGSKHASPASSVGDQTHRSEDIEQMIDREELLDDEWDLLDHNDTGIVSTADEVSSLMG